MCPLLTAKGNEAVDRTLVSSVSDGLFVLLAVLAAASLASLSLLHAATGLHNGRGGLGRVVLLNSLERLDDAPEILAGDIGESGDHGGKRSL